MFSQPPPACSTHPTPPHATAAVEFDTVEPVTNRTSYRLTLPDLVAHAQWQDGALKALMPPGSDFKVELPYNGGRLPLLWGKGRLMGACMHRAAAPADTRVVRWH